MRIAFVTDTFEDGISGGVVTGVRFVEALRQRHEVTVLATGRSAPGKVVLRFHGPDNPHTTSRGSIVLPGRSRGRVRKS